jgi:transposase InsO family protein
MTRSVAAMDVRMATALAGAVGNVTVFCRAQDISRQTFYKWRRRFADGGVEGLAELSRRPHSSPTATAVGVEELIVRTRKELAGAGADHGPDPIRWALAAAGAQHVPSRATIGRVLTRRGLVVPEPRKRPRASLHRFVYARPNECWQSDWTHYRLADGTSTAIAASLDDHSRVVTGLDACLGEGSAALVWSVMVNAIGMWGIPIRSLTDNGLCYSGARRGTEVPFEANLRALGCQPICSSPYHPQTCGKIERLWQTMKKWLDAHGPFSTIADLRTALVEFQRYYNDRRPHASLHGATPAASFAATTPARPADRPLPAPLSTYHGTVTTMGCIKVGPFVVNVGRQWQTHQVTCLKDGDHIAIFSGTRLVRALDVDPTRRYQLAEPRPNVYGHRQPRQAQ